MTIVFMKVTNPFIYLHHCSPRDVNVLWNIWVNKVKWLIATSMLLKYSWDNLSHKVSFLLLCSVWWLFSMNYLQTQPLLLIQQSWLNTTYCHPFRSGNKNPSDGLEYTLMPLENCNRISNAYQKHLLCNVWLEKQLWGEFWQHRAFPERGSD